MGRAKLNELMMLAKMFAEPGREGDLIDWMRALARKRFDEYVDTYGQPPTSLRFLVEGTEYKKAGIIMPFGDVGLPIDYSTHMKQMTKVANKNMSLKDMEPLIKTAVLEGIGFGSSLPELTEKMYREAHENIDLKSWAEARKYGLNLPEQPTIISLEEQEHTVLSMVATYAHMYFPELVEPLGLADLVLIECPKCGEGISSNSTFCNYCGAPVSNQD